MITNPIIPIWLMSLICIFILFLTVYNPQLWKKISSKELKKTPRQKKLLLQYFFGIFIKALIVILLFVINLRFMLPNGESVAIESDTNILFVIDTSVSMRALDYNGQNERIGGAINDCLNIIDTLPNCRYSIITFGDSAKRLVPYTTDATMVVDLIKTINTENDLYAKGTSINIVKDTFENVLKKCSDNKDKEVKQVVFFISDGEITIENERLESFSSLSKYISNGAVLGYGTSEGGKMKRNGSETSNYPYINDYSGTRVQEALSKIDENNLKQIANDLGISYINMNKADNINQKLNEIKSQMVEKKSNDNKVSTYRDIYYYFAIFLVVLQLVDLIIKKRRMQ